MRPVAPDLHQGAARSIEHHTHCMIHDATSFLRLWDAVGDPDLGYNLDIGWTLSQRESMSVREPSTLHGFNGFTSENSTARTETIAAPIRLN